MEDQRTKILNYLKSQLEQSDDRASAYVFDENGKRNPTRNAFVKLDMFMDNFLNGKSDIRWIVLHGLRGAGKTTLLSQLFYKTKGKHNCGHRLYLSVDEIVRILGVQLKDVIKVYEEEILKEPFERLTKPVFLFLDEVQYDKDWAIFIKTVFDRSKKVFVFTTGSSSLVLQTNPDVARRAHYERLFPMSFTEYLKIKTGTKYEIKGLSKKIREAIFQSADAQDSYSRLKLLTPSVEQYWNGVDKSELGKYIKWGTLPYMVKVNNEAIVYEQTKKTLDKVISIDIPEIGAFESKIIARISEILYMIAGSDTVSVTKLSGNMGINRITLTQILDVLEKTETIIRVAPYGSPGKQARKPSKYLFASPAFRSMYFNLVSSSMSETAVKGKLLEDCVGLYLTRCLLDGGYSITYDSSEGGADFIVGIGEERTIFEVGAGKKSFVQVNKTMTRVNSKFGISLSFGDLKLDSTGKSVAIPFNYFLLL